MDTTTYMRVMLTGILSGMQNTLSQAPEEDQQNVKEELYDMLNHGASNLLQIFAPDLELRPNLTTQAILEAEDKLIQEGKFDHMKKHD